MAPHHGHRWRNLCCSGTLRTRYSYSNIDIKYRCYLWFQRKNIQYRISSDIELWIFDNKEKSSISILFNRYRAYCGIHALIVGSTRLLWGPHAQFISKNKHTISNIIWYRTMNIRNQRKIFDIGFVESISRGWNRYRIINIVLYWLISISVNTIPHCSRGKIPRDAAADSRPDSGTGSRLFEINMWMWHYGRTFHRQITVDQLEAVELRKKRVQESRARGAETLRRRRDAAWANPEAASAPQWMTLGECYIVYDIEHDILWHDLRYRTSRLERPSISYTILTCDTSIERSWCLFDMEGMKLDPRLGYQQPFQDSWPSISKVCDLQVRYRIIRPSISNTFDIDIW
jgi:hypothetical protein